MKTRSARMMNSVPAIGWRFSSTSQHLTPVSCAVLADELERRHLELALGALGLRGRGAHLGRPDRARRRACLPSPAAAGGCRAGSRATAPWRNAVPTQSDAVSPPPTTTTCLPPARIGSDGQATTVDVLAADAAVLLHEIGHRVMHAVRGRRRECRRRAASRSRRNRARRHARRAARSTGLSTPTLTP